MAEAAHEKEGHEQIQREERKIVEDTERAGGTVHEFNPDASPQQKAAALKKSMPLGLDLKNVVRGTALVTDMDDGVGAVPGLPPPDTVKPDIKENGIVTTGAGPPKPLPVPKLESKAGWREVGGIDQDDEELHQDWLSTRLGDKYFGSWWHNAGIIFFCCFVCWILGRFGAGFSWIVFVLAISSTYYRTSIKRVRRRVRDDINREANKRRLETDFESTEWLNTFLLKFWIIYEPVLSATIVASVDQILSTQTPAFLDSLRLSKFTLGTKPPRIDQVKTYPKSEEDIVLMDWKFSFTPNDVSDLTARQLKTKVNPKVVLAIRVGKGLVGKDLPILVEDMSCTGIMRVKIKLMAQFPHVKTVDLSFLERPDFDYVLKPIGGDTFGFDIGNIPGLSNFIREQVHANLGPMMYAPNQFTLNIEQMLAGGDLDAAIGVLQVTIYSARGIRNPDKFSGTPDPYVVLSINSGRELARTEIQPSTTTPRWNETKTILINSLNDALSFQIFDYNEIRKDRLLGTANFDLKQLEEDAEHENVNGQIMYNAKSRGEITFDVRYYPVLKPKKLEDGTEQAPPETTTGIVAFTIHQAKDLDARKSLVGTLSPYAVFLLNGKEVHVSKKLKRTNNPIWDEHVEILVHNRMNCRLGVVIKDDRDISVDPIVGSYQIRLNDFIERIEAQQDWFTLAGASTGKVRMEVKWKPVVMPGGMQGSIGYVTPIGVFRFHFKQARDVRNVEAVTGGKSDPYVRVTVSNTMKARSMHVNNDLSPVWDEILYVPVHHIKEQFVLEVMDHQSSGKDRSLGYTQISAGSMVQQNELGEYVESIDPKTRVEPLLNDKKEAKGSLLYSVSFYPCLNVADPEEEEESQKDQAKIQEIPDGPSKPSPNLSEPAAKPSLKVDEPATRASPKVQQTVNGTQTGSPQLRAESIADKSHKSTPSINSVTERKEPPKVHLTPEELVKHSSGVLIFKIIEGELAHKDCYLEVLFDDYAFASYVSSKARSRHQKWDEVGDGFVRELEFSRITMRLRSKVDKTNDDTDVVASLSGDTLDVLKTALNTPTDYVLKSSSGELYRVKVSMKYIPVQIVLDASESINNMGDLRVELVEGKNLPAADRSGYSDPYCQFILNGEKIFKSKVVKKTLNPSFDEKFEVRVPSRTNAEFIVEVYDWDFGGSADFLGRAIIDLTDLEGFQLKTVNIPLDGKSGEIKLKLLFKPGYITRSRRGTSTFGGGAGRVVTGIAGAPVKVVGGGVKGVTKGVGAGVGVAAGGLGFMKRGFTRRKTHDEHEHEHEVEDITPNDLEIARAAVASGGGIKGTSDGTQLAVTGDDNETPINADPVPVTSNNHAEATTTQSRGSSGHGREPSIMSTRTGGGSEAGLLQIAVVEGKGFPAGKEVRVILKTPQREIFKSKTIKSSDPTWNESYSLSSSLTQQIIVSAVEHHTFGSDKEIGEGMFTVEDHRAGDFWLDLKGGAQVRLKVSYQEKKPGTPDKKPSNSPFRRSKQ